MKIPHTTAPVYPSGIAPGRFAATIRRDTPDGCRVALLGLPDDTGVRLNHGRFGAAEGPRFFRDFLGRLGVGTPEGFDWPRVYDAGDVIPSGGLSEKSLADTHQRVTDATAALLNAGLFPIAVGGGHDLTYAFARAVAARHPTLGGVYADAHLDVRETAGSGMGFRRLIEECKVGPLWVHGLLPLVNSAEHTRWFLAHGGRIVNGPDPSDLTPRLNTADQARNLFVSLDLDVIDAAHAPGVSAMNPCGWTPAQAEGFARAAGRDPRVRCFDLMELCPEHDENNRTARLAAFLFLSFLSGFAERPA